MAASQASERAMGMPTPPSKLWLTLPWVGASGGVLA
jgi:hypothetical protein